MSTSQKDLLENRICNVCADDPSIVARTVCPHSPLLTSDPLLGALIDDRYQISAVIGVGGWSTVYKAEDTKLNRTVAVKLLHLHLCVDQEKLQRFQREATAASSINHTNVAVIHDCGTSSGRPFIVMELVEGSSLAEIIRKGRTIPEHLEIISQVCDGLEAIHKHGLIHRDLKPNNIAVANSGVVKVLDFGSAKWTLQDDALTKTDETVGTPSYMSPEQCLGQKLDARTDIYSLGCIIYEALTGVKAFGADGAFACMQLQLKSQPRRFQVVRPGLDAPVALEALVFKALAKAPADRFASIEEMHAALKESTKKPSLLESILPVVAIQKISSRQRRVFLGMVFLAATFIGAGLYITPSLTKQRSLSFPPGHSVGTIYTAAEGVTARTRVGLAQGVVKVPESALVYLNEIPKKQAATLTFLSQLKPNDIQGLDLYDAPITAEAIPQINKLSGLSTLSFSRSDITDAELLALKLPNLKGLDLADTKLSDAALAEIDTRFPNLHWIALRGNAKVTDAGIANIAKLKHVDTIRLTDVSKITGGCLEALGKSETLSFLELTSDKISDESLVALKNAKNLHWLDLASTPITDASMSLICQLSGLHILNLSETNLTDASTTELATMKNLKRLNLSATKISDAKLRELQAALPSCNFDAR